MHEAPKSSDPNYGSLPTTAGIVRLDMIAMNPWPERSVPLQP